jgi:serine/threonine-protein kinase
VLHALKTGTIVADKYRIVRKIAAGGMATIYEAQTSSTGEKVALKIPHDSFRQDRDAIKRFLREARAAMAIESPNVVRTLSVGRLSDGMPFIAMEYIEGMPLRDLMYDTHGCPKQVAIDTTLELVDQIAAAIEAAHAVNVIHRDIKPDNVMVSFGQEGMIARVFDFGLSLLSAEFSISRLTAPGTTFGTPQYMPPEQARNAGAADERADIYALGVIAYEMLAARFPFEGQTVLEVWRNATSGKPVALSVYRPDLPSALVDLVMSALALDPKQRPATATVVRQVLAPFLRAKQSQDGQSRFPASSPAPIALAPPAAPVRSPAVPLGLAAIVFAVLVSWVVVAIVVLSSR